MSAPLPLRVRNALDRANGQGAAVCCRCGKLCPDCVTADLPAGYQVVHFNERDRIALVEVDRDADRDTIAAAIAEQLDPDAPVSVRRLRRTGRLPDRADQLDGHTRRAWRLPA